MAGALLIGTALAIVVGALQVASGPTSAWYFYPITNTGAVGFFANGNHMATLLLAAIPFVPALLLSGKSQQRLRGKSAATITIAIAALGLILIGIALNRSLAALLLVLPVLLATGLMIPVGWRLRWVAVPLVVLGLAGAVAALSSNPLNSTSASSAKEFSLQSRQHIWRTTAAAIAETFPVGTGLGSFQQVYRLQENPDRVDATYVNHAHNDYLELALELGLPGILLILVFFAWWGPRLAQIWSSNLSSPFDRAATIASAAILAHSVVDYPLRTSAMAAVFAMCIGILARFRPAERTSERSDSTGPRHVTIG
jgi:O-antigen ligase